MTLAEFKAWFEGFTETLEAAPNDKQWERIKARVAEINGTVTTYPVFVDRYVAPFRQWWESGPSVRPMPVFYSSSTPADSAASVSLNAASIGEGTIGNPDELKRLVYNPMHAMMDLGKAEYRSLDS